MIVEEHRDEFKVSFGWRMPPSWQLGILFSIVASSAALIVALWR